MTNINLVTPNGVWLFADHFLLPWSYFRSFISTHLLNLWPFRTKSMHLKDVWGEWVQVSLCGPTTTCALTPVRDSDWLSEKDTTLQTALIRHCNDGPFWIPRCSKISWTGPTTPMPCTRRAKVVVWLSSLGACMPLLRNFCDSVVPSAIYYAVLWSIHLLPLICV